MLRHAPLVALATFLLAGCESTGTSSLEARLKAASQDARTNAAADDYGGFLVARYASLTNDPVEAAENYARVARARPDDQSIVDRAVFSALLADNFKLAHSIATASEGEARLDSALARMTLATHAMEAGRYGEVAPFLEGEAPGIFDSLIFKALRAWVLFGQNEPAKAQLALLDASSGDPYLDSLVLNLLAIMEVASGNDDAALETFSRVDSNGTLIATGAEYYARLLSSRGESDVALEVLNGFRENAGPNPLVSDLIHKLERGKTLAIKRPSAAEGAALSIYVPAAALASRTQTDLPGVYYALALHLDPDLYAARALWADALDTAGRREESIAMLRTIPTSSPYHAGAQGQLAWALHRDRKDTEALDLVYTTLSDEPRRDVKVQMGDLLRSLGRNGEAEKVFTEIIEADEQAGRHDWRLYYARGALREQLGHWPLAEEDLKRAKSLNPDAPEVLNYLGYSWIDRGLNLEEGLNLVRQALALNPQSGEITDSLGWAHYKLGNFDEAIGYLEHAVELQPGIAEINEHLGDAYWAVGRNTEARYQWQRAITLLESDTEIERLRMKFLTGPNSVPVHAAQRSR